MESCRSHGLVSLGLPTGTNAIDLERPIRGEQLEITGESRWGGGARGLVRGGALSRTPMSSFVGDRVWVQLVGHLVVAAAGRPLPHRIQSNLLLQNGLLFFPYRKKSEQNRGLTCAPCRFFCILNLKVIVGGFPTHRLTRTIFFLQESGEYSGTIRRHVDLEMKIGRASCRERVYVLV